jgi:hypothetical protein
VWAVPARDGHGRVDEVCGGESRDDNEFGAASGKQNAHFHTATPVSRRRAAPANPQREKFQTKINRNALSQ